MSRFRLRKWYFDFLTGGLDYGFVYLADVAFLGFTFRSLTLHLARAGKGVPITATIPVVGFHEEEAGGCTFSGGGMSFRDGRGRIEAHGAGSSVHLAYAPLLCSDPRPVVIRGGGRGEIVWRPLSVKSRVSGTILLGCERFDIQECNGYVDYLESSIPPPVVPVRSLVWGRLHDPGLDLVFVRAAGSPGNGAWSRVSIYSGNSVTDCSEVRIIDGPCADEDGSLPTLPAEYRVEAAFGSCRIQLKVRQVAAVQRSSFIDHQQLNPAAVRYFLRKLTRDPRSTKWLSVADVVLEEGGMRKELHNIAMIDELALL